MKYKEPPWIKLGIKMRMGLKSLNPNEWLPASDGHGPDGEREYQMKLKKAIRKNFLDKIFIALPHTMESGNEVLYMIKKYFESLNISLPTFDEENLHPLDYAGCLIPEDLLILEKKNDKWVLTGGALYFPAHWQLSEKISKKLVEIHDPVPHYKQNLETTMDKFFNNMIVGPISARRNWTVQIDKKLFVPNRVWINNLKTEDVSQRVFIREEYQTLRKLPQSNAILFTIRTHLWPIKIWNDQKKELLYLIELLKDMSDETKKYRGTKFYINPLELWIKGLT